MITAEEFFRNKIKEQNPNREVVTLSQELITAEQGMRWANEIKQLHLHSVVKSLPTKIIIDYLKRSEDFYIDDSEIANRFYNAALNDVKYFIKKEEEKLKLGVRLSLPDVDNYDYLRGFIDGYGGEEPHDVFPDGFKDINDVWDRMYELDCKNCEDDK